MKTLLLIYVITLVIMSLIALIAYGRDKRLAKTGKWRTPEKTLLILAACFGGIGAFAGMQLFRHKTKHTAFQIVVPSCMIIQLALLAYLAYTAL